MKRTWAAAAAGVASGALTLGLATLFAGVLTRLGAAGGTPSPVVAVGEAFVDRTPLWLKDFAVSTFGTNDKLALFIGMAIVLVLLCAALGLLGAGRHTGAGHPRAALVGFAVLAGVALAAVLSRPHAVGPDIIPTVVGTLAGLWSLSALLGRLRGSGDDGERAGIGRRRVLVLGGGLVALGAVAAAAGQGLGGLAARVAKSRAATVVPEVPDPITVPDAAQLDVPGITPFIVPDADFYRIDTALVVPQVDTAEWKLRVHGLVDHEVTIDWPGLLSKPMQQAMITLTCVSNEVGGNLAGNAIWTGWPVRELLRLAGPQPGADMVLSTSSDGWTAGTPLGALTDDRNALLAVGMNGKPLPIEHGFPVRMVVPGLYGYVSATKWVVDLEVTRFADAAGYWTPRGWSVRGPIKTASRIDVPGSGTRVQPGMVAVAGVAWSQHRGIKAVEVRVDDGDWKQARLGAQPTIDAWREWVLEWQATKGSHTLTVRAIDTAGEVQTSVEAPPVPNGASGWHTVTVSVG